MSISDSLKPVSGLLHLADRGRFLVFGSNLVLSSRPEKLFLVLYSAGLAANSSKKLENRFSGKTIALKFSPGELFDQPELKVIAVTNRGLAVKIRELLNNLENSAE